MSNIFYMYVCIFVLAFCFFDALRWEHDAWRSVFLVITGLAWLLGVLAILLYGG